MIERASIREIFDGFAGVELQAALEAGANFRFAKRRLISTLRGAHQVVIPRGSSLIAGIWITGTLFVMLGPERLKTPFGWRWERDLERDCRRLMPIWMWWPRRVWLNRYVPLRPFIRLGFFESPDGIYSEFRWSWKFWKSHYIAGRRYHPRIPAWWYRFGYWCERKEFEYRRDVPRPWTTELVPDGKTSGRAQLVKQMQARIAENLGMTNHHIFMP